MAGGVELLGRAGEPSRQVTWDDVRDADPELLVLAACGFDAHRTAEEAGDLPLDVPAVAVDANARFSRPAPRVAEGVAQLAHLFHPDAAPDPGPSGGRRQARVNPTTHSMWCVCGNMSTGCTGPIA